MVAASVLVLAESGATFPVLVSVSVSTQLNLRSFGFRLKLKNDFS